jgi:NADPH:quinone reductase-like Zn-dependent oxidoreductase
LGAKHILNYRTQSNWGTEAKKLTPDGRGVDHVVDVGGPTTLAESMNAVRLDGLITSAGFIAGNSPTTTGPDAMSALWRLYVMRGILLGTRDMLRDMVAWFGATGVKPAVDDVVFSLEDAKKAYERLDRQEHFSKVIIKIA